MCINTAAVQLSLNEEVSVVLLVRILCKCAALFCVSALHCFAAERLKAMSSDILYVKVAESSAPATTTVTLVLG